MSGSGNTAFAINKKKFSAPRIQSVDMANYSEKY